MIDPDDKEFCSWAPELPDFSTLPDRVSPIYSFLAMVPLEVKREQFRALNNVIRDYRISDLFTTASQARWAAGVIRIGLQLPLEDLDLISDALDQSSELLHTMHEIDFCEEEPGLSLEDQESLTSKCTVSVIWRLGVLFNPHVFFWDQMPTREVVHQSNQRMGQITEPCIRMPQPLRNQRATTPPSSPLRQTLSAKGGLLQVTGMRSGKPASSTVLTSESSANIVPENQGDRGGASRHSCFSRPTHVDEPSADSSEKPNAEANEDDDTADDEWLEVISSREDATAAESGGLRPQLQMPRIPLLSIAMQGDPPAGFQPASSHVDSLKQQLEDKNTSERQQARLRRAAALWEGYVELLSRALRMFLVALKHDKMAISGDQLPHLHLWLVTIVDLILSQDSSNPRLVPWTKRYRPYIGAEIWDITWATLGDRLESIALELLAAVWGNLVGTTGVNWEFMKNFPYWIHRESVMKEWLHMLSDTAGRVMRSHYVCSLDCKLYFESRQPPMFEAVANLSDSDAEALLYYYTTVPLDTHMIPHKTYYAYVIEVCEIVNRMLDIKQAIEVDGVVHLQRPPSANYILHYFGTPLFNMGMAETDGTSESVKAKTQALVVLSRILAMRVQRDDPIWQKYRDRILRILYEVIHKDMQAQIILPSVQLLLNETGYIRPLIPDIVALTEREMQLVSPLLLQREKWARRRQALAVFGSLIAFPLYYYSLGILDRVDQLHEYASFQIDRSVFQPLGDEWSNRMLSVDQLMEQIANSKFVNIGKENPKLNSIIENIFKNLMTALATETDDLNLRHTTSILLLFLLQYSDRNPGYISLYLRFLIEQLRISTRTSMSMVYIYALMMGASLTWEGKFDYAQQGELVIHLVRALSDCDRHLYRYTQWDRYHQLLITSIQCLNTWVGLSFNHIHIQPETKEILVGISERLDKYLKATEGHNVEDLQAVGRLVHLNTGAISSIVAGKRDYSTAIIDEADYMSRNPQAALRDLQIVSVTSFSPFTDSRDPGYVSTTDSTAVRRTHKISPSLYRVLFTTLVSFNSILTQAFKQAWPIPSRDRPDILMTRMIMRKEKLPDNSQLLCNYHPDLLRILDGFRPVSVSWYSSLRRSLYSEIVFENPDGVPGENTRVLVTARYPSATRYWVMQPGDLINSDMLDDAHVASILATERSLEGEGRTAEQQGKCDRSWLDVELKAGMRKLSSRGQGLLRRFKPLVDIDGHEELTDGVLREYADMCQSDHPPVVQFTAARPRSSVPYGNAYFRMCTSTCHTGDISFIKVSQKLLEDVDRLDDLSMPYIAHAGVVYLESYEKLLTHPASAKAQLRSISTEFCQLLNQLGRGKLKPMECLKRNPDDAYLLKYKFWAENTEVAYYLAPNISALVGGRPLDSEYSEVFCSRLYYSGISVIWLNDSPHSIDMAHLWNLIDTASRWFESTTDDDGDESGAAPSSNPPESSNTKQASSTAPRKPQGASVISIRAKRRSNGKKTHGHSAVTRKRTHKQSALDKASAAQQCKSGSSSAQDSPSGGRRRARDIFRKAIRRHRGVSTLATNESSSKTSRASSASRGNESPVVHPDEDRQSQAPPQSGRDASVGNAAADPKEESPRDPPPAGNPDPSNRPATSDDKASGALVKYMIVLAPLKDTGGRLIRVRLAAAGSTERMNKEFLKMTGPLQSEMVVQARLLANILSITILDAAANIASLRGENFSAIFKRRVMLATMADEHGARFKTVEEAEKALYPVGRSGMEMTMVYNK